MKINYPNGETKTPEIKRVKTHGMLFEEAINQTNEYYRNKDLAHIYKKPTPVQVVKVSYPTRTKAKIVEAYYRKPSTTDYNGIYKGKYIDFEAKETNNLTFSFTHIFSHQLKHLEAVKKHGGLAFVIIFYKKVDKVVIIDIEKFMELYNIGLKGGKKSISYEDALTVGIEVERKFAPPIDYLAAVDKLYF
jgi:recombination protein U